jgi:hypothetical protein
MIVFVPTRARISKQVTMKEFDLPAKEYATVFVVPSSEEVTFRQRWPKVTLHVVPDHFRLSDIRQYLVDMWNVFGDPHHVCMDDDLVFLRRKAPLDVHQRKGNAADAKDAFARMESWLKLGYVHGSLSQRGGNNHCEEAFKVIGRSTDCHFYNAEIIKNEGIKINDVILRQDFHLTLSLLELGYPNLIDHEFMSGQKDGTPGGCQTYRNHEMLEQQAHLLAELHPGFVKVVTKERIGGFGTSTDVRMSWQKAFCSRINERKTPYNPMIQMAELSDE